jgi:hypothetical protein
MEQQLREKVKEAEENVKSGAL